MRLRCPECGRARIFKPWRQSRTLEDWFAPLHGCPHCDYAYQREPGYFLAAICAVNYGVVCGSAIFASLCLDIFFSPPVWVYIAFIFVPMPIGSFLFARHAKAIFLAIDHFIEPGLTHLLGGQAAFEDQ
jgi:uncharacterized protein (DUF983 family)